MTAIRRSNSRGQWLAPLLVLFAGAIAYSNSFQGPFIFDDNLAIVDNPQVRSLDPFRFPSTIATTISGRPILIFSFAVNYAIAGLHREIYHITNLLIHLACALFLYGIVRQTLLSPKVSDKQSASNAPILAALIALLWVVHPLTTQSVTFIVQRAESLAGLFLLATLYCTIRLTGGSRWWGVLAVITCACGMATKEIVAAAPILALLYDRTFVTGSLKDALARRWKFYLALAATWLLILYSLHTGLRGTMVGFNLGISPLDYARTELNVIARYLRLAFCPTDLTLDYADWPVAVHWSDVSWEGWLVLAVAIFFAFCLYWRPWLGFLGAWFFLILAPTSSVLPIKQEAAAEQRMYLPLAAVICLVVISLSILVQNRRILRQLSVLAACAAAVAFTSLTLARNQQYSDAVTIWTDTVAKRPNDSRARYNLGQVWAKISFSYPANSPEAQAAERNAQQQFQIVHEMDASVSGVVFALGESYERSGDSAAAEDVYTKALLQYPGLASDLLVQRGNLRARRQDWTDAKADYLAAIASTPTDIEPHYFLGILYQQLSDWKNAADQFSQTLAINPAYKDAAARLQAVRHFAGKTP
jgi:tetratricopeptide (TPR) repeat protein